jgi:hypothetical protein
VGLIGRTHFKFQDNRSGVHTAFGKTSAETFSYSFGFGFGLHLVKHNAKSDVTGGTVWGITGAGCDAVSGTIRGVAQKAAAFDQPISVHGGGLSFPSF